jgi:two-component system cell cycle sensor histidine kinase/response regulator CckA
MNPREQECADGSVERDDSGQATPATDPPDGPPEHDVSSPVPAADGRDSGQSAEKLRMILRCFEQSHDFIFALDTEGNLTMVNQTMCLTLGYSEQELLGRSVWELVDDASRHVIAEAVASVQRGTPVPLCTTPVISRSGQRLFMDISGQRLREGDRVIGSFHIARDVSDRESVEAEVQRAQALEALGNLAAGVAHDFNNVLTVIQGNTGLAEASVDQPETVQKHLAAVESAVERARALAGQLLTFAHGGAPVKEDLDVSGLIDDTAHFTLSGSNVAFKSYVEPSLPQVNADRNQITQVIQSLVLNAREAMPSGGVVTVTARRQQIDGVRTLADAAPGSYVVATIEDAGVGIKAADLGHIFDPYFTTKSIGHGLGLPIARSIVRRHGGDMEVESCPGVGTTIRFCLPVAAGSRPTDGARSQTIHATPVSGKGRVLVMDDEQAVAEVVCAMAKRLGYTAVAVPDGQTAIDVYALAAGTPAAFDVVVMDLTVPGGMGGKEAVTRLLDRFPDARVVVSSGYSTDAAMSDYSAYGFVGAIAKPYTIQELSEVLYPFSREGD